MPSRVIVDKDLILCKGLLSYDEQCDYVRQYNITHMNVLQTCRDFTLSFPYDASRLTEYMDTTYKKMLDNTYARFRECVGSDDLAMNLPDNGELFCLEVRRVHERISLDNGGSCWDFTIVVGESSIIKSGDTEYQVSGGDVYISRFDSYTVESIRKRDYTWIYRQAAIQQGMSLLNSLWQVNGPSSIFDSIEVGPDLRDLRQIYFHCKTGTHDDTKRKRDDDITEQPHKRRRLT